MSAPPATATDPVRVGVLSLHDSKETKAILNAVEALGHHPEWLREENTVVRFDGDSVRLTPDVDVVVNRLLLSNTDQPVEELGLAMTLDRVRPMLNRPMATALAAHKIATAAALVGDHLQVPRTTLALSSETLNRVRGEFGEEVVYKTAIGTHGGGAWKVGSHELVTATVGKRRAFLQELIGRPGERPHDLRVYLVDGEVVGAMVRIAAEGEWRANVALGGAVEGATETAPAVALELARAAATTVGLDVAGVDLVEGVDGWYVLEVNPTAGFRGLYRATGVSPAPYIARLAIERVGGRVDPERVDQLASTLDDSRPSCTPTPVAVTFDEPTTIGFTEYVAISGTSGTKTVVAKSDSGAARTSIDRRLAADIGAGPSTPISTVRLGRSKPATSTPVVDLVLGIQGDQHTVAATIEDHVHVPYPVVLGRDVLEHYRLDVSRQVTDHDEPQVDE